ncbi:Mov34/MPN/PAD-1 family protein [Undibacterium sp. 14-3-2]|uniref:Mov34/MPN/PAD-1 family protein n=1 Tax=Undibacterium sp. 14-3-2 TaxID=2800129 RepID=UPI0019070EAF|nr:Mov34/MPN/PAD-1 family protein [Undibacterium sp. 14-3-2]MBK1888670.1 Mov34/MPN/PAD-1 family protein [Undibacterium sp. 14-3-2]
MINVVLNSHCIRLLRSELLIAGSNEIGGVMAAEQVGDGSFIVVDLSVQRNGTSSHFVRDPVPHREFIRSFHERMGNQPERFNYLGEWHSHPNYLATPSDEDFSQMQKLVEDEEQNSTFLALMVVKLNMGKLLRGSIYGFRPGCRFVRGQLQGIEEGAVEEEYVPLTLSFKRH